MTQCQPLNIFFPLSGHPLSGNSITAVYFWYQAACTWELLLQIYYYKSSNYVCLPFFISAESWIFG